MHIFVENLGFRVSGVDFTSCFGLWRQTKARNWIQRSEKDHLVQIWCHLRFGGRFLVHVECVEQKRASPFIPMRGGWQARRENEDMVCGGREEVGRGAAGRCGMGVW